MGSGINFWKKKCPITEGIAFSVDINLPGKDGVSLATQLSMLPQPHAWSLVRETRTAPPTPFGQRRWIIF
jgi:hypothetical protein